MHKHEESERGGQNAPSSASQLLHPSNIRRAKRPRISTAKLQGPPRRSPRLNTALCESLEQQRPIVPKQSIIKRSHETEISQPQASIDSAATSQADLKTYTHPVVYWTREGTWPKEYFKSSAMSPAPHPPSEKQSELGSLIHSLVTPSDQKPRELKSALYLDSRYPNWLKGKGCFMHQRPNDGVNKDSERLCHALLHNKQVVPTNTLFDKDMFAKACAMLAGRNEAKVIQDITRLLVPSAQALALRCAELECLAESVNEGWNNSIPLLSTRPQPDYSVGFQDIAFSTEQLEKLSPWVGDFVNGDQSYFMATNYMYFPFLTCEVKCGNEALEVADRQNAHSITLAVRAVVELLRLVKREKEVDREILAFSVSHDDCSVRLYGHYPIISGPETTFHRMLIRSFGFTELGGKEKWTTYTFIANVYHTWMPAHFKRLCSAIDDLPSDVNFDVVPSQQDSKLLKKLESHHLSGTLTGSVAPTEGDGQSDMEAITQNTSVPQEEAPKKQKGKRANTSPTQERVLKKQKKGRAG